MKSSYILLSLAFAAVHAAPKSKTKTQAHLAGPPVQGIKGFDVSHHQATVDWAKAKADGAAFAYIKASEGAGVDKTFASRFAASGAAGYIRGAYHFAHPGSGSGADQAKFFIAHGGGWKADGKTLPGAVDLEAPPGKPSGPAACYNLSSAAMVKWITDFSNAYHASTKRYPVIYTTTNWWKMCTGNSPAFGAKNPLWLARFRAKTVGPLPAGWHSATIWQYDDHGPNPGDPDVYLGDAAGLKRLAMSG